ncbi:hypothetical protein SSX86_010282 [Deinandra increscens subsp. villosa]|uniref:Uncharacterized protein n=1 Tax=Deinandra increscens subsp. villosa TaxID=3103831 RepID=A0AAP0H2D7_9ASTR
MEFNKLLSFSLSLVLILSVAESFDYDEKELKTEEGMEAMYDRWRAHHKVSEKSPEKFNAFKATAQLVHNHNKLKKSYKLKINSLADMTNEEYRSAYTHQNLKLPGPGCPACPACPAASGCPACPACPGASGCPAAANAKDLPPRVDWREKNVISPPRWISVDYMALTSIEAINAIRTGQNLVLSQHQVYHCKPTCKISDGIIFDFAKDTGIATLESYPPEIKGCDKSKFGKTLVTIDGNQYPAASAPTEEAVMKAVAQQPILVGFSGKDDEYKAYAGGIFSGPCGGEGKTILIVGYDQDPDGTKYWIAKAAFEEDWGEKGYIRILRTPEGICQMYTYTVMPLKSEETRNIEL